jgi:type IV pilus assembly protein PilO
MEVSPGLESRLDQIAKLPQAVRVGVILGISLGIAAFYYFSVYESQNAQLTQLRAKELELQRRLSEVRSIAANLAAFEAEIGDLEVKLADALRQLPNEKQLEVLLADISNLGKTAGVEIKSFKRESERVHDFYAEVPISIKLEGTYHEVARFFDSISRLPRIVNMGAIHMKVASDSSVETRLGVSGTATTFRFVGNS